MFEKHNNHLFLNSNKEGRRLPQEEEGLMETVMEGWSYLAGCWSLRYG